MDALEFTKGHGTGNDFVIIPDPEARLVLSPKLVAGLCDRRFGIGGDGVLRVVRTTAAARVPGSGVPEELVGPVEWFMDYRNADGSVAEMCGNGARVFARYLVETGLVATSEVTVGTRAGAVAAVVSQDTVSVTLGNPRWYATSSARLRTVDGTVAELPGEAVDCGNPHLVCSLPPEWDLSTVDLSRPPEVDRELFPEGVNVELFTPGPAARTGQVARVRMRVHERGVGETLSCGSGAVAVAAVVLRRAGRETGVVGVDVPGGRLTAALTGSGCVLSGPAVLVAQGTVDVSTLP